MMPSMDQVKDMFIRAERLRMSALCLDMEIDHIKAMSTMYRKTELMDKANSWSNGFWPFVELQKIKGCANREDLYDVAVAQLQQCADMCEIKNRKLEKLLREVNDADSSQADPAEH